MEDIEWRMLNGCSCKCSVNYGIRSIVNKT